MTAAALVVAVLAGQSAPVERVWIRSKATGAAARVSPDVHSVSVRGDFVEVESAGLSLASFGPLQVGGDGAGEHRFRYRIPRSPRPADIPPAAPVAVTGTFINGVPIYNTAGAVSYRDQGLWHLDAVAQAAQVTQTAPLFRALMDRRGHSPIIGFALDGYPVYGPYGWDEQGRARTFRSSYRLRNITRRDTLSCGTLLTPAQEGPAVSAEFPLGSFVEDYIYTEGSGDLDEHNGRFAVTPEFPAGTYAYFTATDGSGNLMFPYLIGPSYRGRFEAGARGLVEVGRAGDLWLSASTMNVRTGEPVEWVFEASAPVLENVHERKLHLLVISEDLNDFVHVHPERVTERIFGLRHRFMRPGRYRLYADFTPAGGAQTIARFQVTVKGQPLALPENETGGLRVAISTSSRPRTGADLSLRFAITDIRTGAPAVDLEPFLGAWGHLVAVSRDGDFIHAHPKEMEAPAGDPWRHSHAGAGPSPSVIELPIGFRRPGVYKLWFQVQRDGRALTFPFTLNVAPGVAAEPAAIPAGAIRIEVTSSGFAPARVMAPAGRTLTLAFERTDAQNCGSRVVIPSLGVDRELTPGSAAVIDVPAIKPDTEIRFTCGMGMYKGAIVAVRD